MDSDVSVDVGAYYVGTSKVSSSLNVEGVGVEKPLFGFSSRRDVIWTKTLASNCYRRVVVGICKRLCMRGENILSR